MVAPPATRLSKRTAPRTSEMRQQCSSISGSGSTTSQSTPRPSSVGRSASGKVRRRPERMSTRIRSTTSLFEVRATTARRLAAAGQGEGSNAAEPFRSSRRQLHSGESPARRPRLVAQRRPAGPHVDERAAHRAHAQPVAADRAAERDGAARAVEVAPVPLEEGGTPALAVEPPQPGLEVAEARASRALDAVGIEAVRGLDVGRGEPLDAQLPAVEFDAPRVD